MQSVSDKFAAILVGHRDHNAKTRQSGRRMELLLETMTDMAPTNVEASQEGESPEGRFRVGTIGTATRSSPTR